MCRFLPDFQVEIFQVAVSYARLTILLIVALNASSLAEVTRCLIQARISFLSRSTPFSNLISGFSSLFFAHSIQLSRNFEAHLGRT